MADDPAAMQLVATLSLQKGELLHELKCAHRIIRNALNIVTTEQKFLWAEKNAKDNADGEGITRAYEREAVIARCAASLSSAKGPK